MSEKQGEECFVKNDEPRELEHYITITITEWEAMKNIKLHRYINAAHINANDNPHTVVEKLQAAIDAAIISTGESKT